MVGICVTEHDPLDPAEPDAGLPDRVRHVLDPGVEHRHAPVVLDQVDVHRPEREPAANDPDAVGDPLGLVALEPRAEPGPEVGDPRQPALGLRPRRRQDPKLAGHRGEVDVGVVVRDPVVLERHHVAALEFDPGAIGGQALEHARPREGPPCAPPDDGMVACARDVEDLEREVRERREQPA